MCVGYKSANEKLLKVILILTLYMSNNDTTIPHDSNRIGKNKFIWNGVAVDFINNATSAHQNKFSMIHSDKNYM